MLRTIQRWLLTKLLAERKARRAAEWKALKAESAKFDFQTMSIAASRDCSVAILAAKGLQKDAQAWEQRAKAAEEKLALAETFGTAMETNNDRLEKRCAHLEKKVRHLRTELDKRAIPDGLSRTWDPEQA